MPMRYVPERKGRTMTNEIEVQRLINFETATDGTAVKLVVCDVANRKIGIILTIETLSALLMTLPAIASSAVKRAHNDPSMRITYPLREFEIELGPDNLRIPDDRDTGRIHGLLQPHRGTLARTGQGTSRKRWTSRQNALAVRLRPREYALSETRISEQGSECRDPDAMQTGSSLAVGDREMSFPPLNLYTFAAARGQFLRPDVQALLKSASVGLYFDFANSHAPVLRREAVALRKQLDALLFGEPSRPAQTERPALTIVRRRRSIA
jgi:hypothetical protein